MLLVESDLDRRERATLHEPFHRLDVATVDLDGQESARLDRLSIEQHGAGAAAGGVATDVCARKGEVDPQEVDQEDARLHVAAFLGAVDSHGHFHDFTS
jgi:hypothetical protein